MANYRARFEPRVLGGLDNGRLELIRLINLEHDFDVVLVVFIASILLRTKRFVTQKR